MRYLVILLSLVLFSCVSKKKYAELEIQRAALADKTTKLGNQNEEFLNKLSSQEEKIKSLQSENLELKQLLEEERNQRDNFMVEPKVIGDLIHPVENKPKFIGGESALESWVAKNVRYPQMAKEAGIQGKVYVQFMVDVDGSIKDAKVVRGVHKLLDSEALRVIKSMPKWKPGTSNGKPVKTRMNLPIAFKLA